MSTYLVAFVIGELEIITDGRISIHTCKDATLGEYALKIAVLVLDFLETQFNIKYLLEKLDFLALPYMIINAMQNWGLITSRENYLLYEKNELSSEKYEIAETVAHEIAHQWLGNFVTFVW